MIDKNSERIRVHFIYNSPRICLYEKSHFSYKNKYTTYGLGDLYKHNIVSTYTDNGFGNLILRSLDKIVNLFLKKITRSSIFSRHIFSLKKYIKHSDIIFATADRCGISLLVLKYLKIINKPIIYTSIGLPKHLDKFKQKKVLTFYKEIFKKADKIICYGFHEQYEINKLIEVPLEKIQFIPFGVDVEYFKTSSEPIKKKFILSIGADSSRDYKIFLEVAESLPELDFCLITLPNNLKNLAMPENVKVLYHVPFTKLKDYYDKSYFVVLPIKENSYTGGTSCLLQAMSLKKAVIVTKTKAISQGYNLENGENCVFVTHGNRNELKDKILYLLSNPDEIKRIGENAYRNVVENLTWNKYVTNLACIIREVADGKVS